MHVTDSDLKKIEDELGKYLIEEGIKIAFAESCTGGLASHLLTNFSGISKSFILGAVTYSAQMKEKVLGVDRSLIERYGEVSFEVARVMAERVRVLAGSDIGVSTTGIAGPTGATKDYPVGTVFFGVAKKSGSAAYKKVFYGKRVAIKLQAAKYALLLAYRAARGEIP